MAKNSDVFVRITNQQMYTDMMRRFDAQDKKLEGIETRVITTNGKVRKSLWMASTGIALFTIIFVLLIEHVAGKL